MSRSNSLVISLIILFLTVSCNTGQSREEVITPQATEFSQTSNPGAYPAPDTLTAPYPGSIISEDPVLIGDIPAPSPGRSTITGVLIARADNPAKRVLLSLAGVIEAADGTPQVAEFDRASAPKTITDDAGRFVFVDVEPGQYALVVDRITEAFLLNDPITGGNFLFESLPGDILDLGELIHPELPGT